MELTLVVIAFLAAICVLAVPVTKLCRTLIVAKYKETALRLSLEENRLSRLDAHDAHARQQGDRVLDFQQDQEKTRWGQHQRNVQTLFEVRVDHLTREPQQQDLFAPVGVVPVPQQVRTKADEAVKEALEETEKKRADAAKKVRPIYEPVTGGEGFDDLRAFQ